MAGDTENVAVWAEADILIGNLDAPIPDAGEDFDLTGDHSWRFAGILDGSAGFVESQSSTNQDHTGWGVGVIATTRKDLTITMAFTALEDNEQTLSLRYNTEGITFDGSSYSGDLAGRDLQKKFRIARVVRSGTKMKRQVTKNFAQIDTLGDVTENEDGLASLPVTVKIYPVIEGGRPVYWTTDKGDVAEVEDPDSEPTYTLAITGSPTGGTFTLTVDGDTTAGIAYNATNDAIKAALEALGLGGVQVSGGTLPGNAKTIVFQDDVTVTGSGASLTGGTSPAVTVTAV